MHHTKDKGDAGVGFVIASLMSHEFKVALPLSEHLPFDLVAISEDGQLRRVSVKYRAARHGLVRFSLRSSWADRHGSHVRKHRRTDYDALAIYCPDTCQVYYVNVADVTGSTVHLVIQPKKKAQKNSRLAERFLDPHHIFAPVAQV